MLRSRRVRPGRLQIVPQPISVMICWTSDVSSSRALSERSTCASPSTLRRNARPSSKRSPMMSLLRSLSYSPAQRGCLGARQELGEQHAEGDEDEHRGIDAGGIVVAGRGFDEIADSLVARHQLAENGGGEGIA